MTWTFAACQLCGRDDPAIERALSAFEKFTKVMVADPMWNARRSKKKRDDEETLLARAGACPRSSLFAGPRFALLFVSPGLGAGFRLPDSPEGT